MSRQCAQTLELVTHVPDLSGMGLPMVTTPLWLWSHPPTLMVLSEDPLHMVSPLTHKVHTGPSWPTKVPLHLYRCWESIAEGGGEGRGEGREGCTTRCVACHHDNNNYHVATHSQSRRAVPERGVSHPKEGQECGVG